MASEDSKHTRLGPHPTPPRVGGGSQGMSWETAQTWQPEALAPAESEGRTTAMCGLHPQCGVMAPRITGAQRQ